MKVVPEFKPLIGYRDSDNTSKHQTYISEMSFAYLGLGNAAYINSDIYYEYEQLKKDEYSIVAFRKLVDKISDTSLGSMFLEVDKVLK